MKMQLDLHYQIAESSRKFLRFVFSPWTMDKQIDGLDEFLNPEPDFLTKIQNDYRTEKPRLLTLNSEFKFPATKVAAHLHVKPLYTRL